MATKQNKGLREGRPASLDLEQTPSEVGKLKEFKPQPPSAIEGGGVPSSRVGEETLQTIASAPEGVDPALGKAIKTLGTPADRLNIIYRNAFLEGKDLAGRPLDPYDMAKTAISPEGVE